MSTTNLKIEFSQAKNTKYPKALIGLDESSQAYLLAHLIKLYPKQSLVHLASDLKSALTLKQNLEFFLGSEPQTRLLWFPPHDCLPFTGIAPGADIVAERIDTLNKLSEGQPFVLISTWDALLRKIMPPSILKAHQLSLHLKGEIKREKLVSWLVEHGYRQESVVESPGDFALRGFIIDVFTPNERYPLRLEFDGDCLVEAREFDPVTQRTRDPGPGTRDLKKIILIPVSEVLYGDEFVPRALKQIKKFADALELPATLRREAAEKIENAQDFSGKETFLSLFYEEASSLLDFLPLETLFFLPDPLDLKERAGKFFLELKRLHETTKGVEKLVPPELLLNSFEGLEGKLKNFKQVWINPLLSFGQEIPVHKIYIRGSQELKNQWSPEQLKKWQKAGLKVRLVCHTAIQAERLKDLLENRGILHPTIEVGRLSHGFDWVEEGLIVLTEEEIFGHKTFRRTEPAKQKFPFTNFLELREGDSLVHEGHGVCRYKGLRHLKIGNVLGDYLTLEFLGGDKLYLPVYRLNVIQRYIGGTPTPPLDSLRGVRWKKIKARAGKEIYRIALELLKTQAERKLHPGTAFPPPDYLDEEFASHFPYDETRDQAQAIEDVLKDMQNHKAMDRLVAGDVGFGKTEVAMRAAFKAVSFGKQAALLVPTTILALQHFETFLERFSKFGISVAMLSRFTSRKEQKEILAKLNSGPLDIVIGTHRLLMKDVAFKNLGLLIIDEEHRFGVRHKERMKKLKPTVDVITLSATPIPRTLSMSLVGLKDFSIIHTPPVDRLAIRTFIAKWDDALIRLACEQELARGGQVFFVHNRVAAIPSIYKKLKNLFPNVSIAISHAQMREDALEKTIIDFLHQRIQILLTTAIIESGIDVPNANTIIINRADTFGLAEVYQLRGRVGRSNRQAYCYLLIPDEEAITEEAKKRLSVLTRYTELGAGFQIASHDLEIRGAGNLLGTSQAGFMEEIGYELYTKLLARTIRELKGEKLEEEVEPEIQLKIPAYIPEGYVSDAALRMGFYKRLSHFSKPEEIQSFEAELKDRFGLLPEEAKNLLEIVAIKLLAAKAGLKFLKFDGEAFILERPPHPPKPSGPLRIESGRLKEPEAILEGAKKVLREALTWTTRGL